MSPPRAHLAFLKHLGTRSFCCDTVFWLVFRQKRHQLIAPISFKLHFASCDLGHGQAVWLPRVGREGNPQVYRAAHCPLGQHSIPCSMWEGSSSVSVLVFG